MVYFVYVLFHILTAIAVAIAAPAALQDVGGDEDVTSLLQLPSPRRNLCMRGKLLPEVWLIGAAKCGTSSVAEDLVSAGVASTCAPTKEDSFFALELAQNR